MSVLKQNIMPSCSGLNVTLLNCIIPNCGNESAIAIICNYFLFNLFISFKSIFMIDFIYDNIVFCFDCSSSTPFPERPEPFPELWGKYSILSRHKFQNLLQRKKITALKLFLSSNTMVRAAGSILLIGCCPFKPGI